MYVVDIVVKGSDVNAGVAGLVAGIPETQFLLGALGLRDVYSRHDHLARVEELRRLVECHVLFEVHTLSDQERVLPLLKLLQLVLPEVREVLDIVNLFETGFHFILALLLSSVLLVELLEVRVDALESFHRGRRRRRRVGSELRLLALHGVELQLD